MIHSVIVIDQHPEGPTDYTVGGKVWPGGYVIHRIVQQEDKYRFWATDDQGRTLVVIDKCPVVVRYKPE